MSYASLDELRGVLGGGETRSAYEAKMLHPFPEAESKDRGTFLLSRTAGKRVLEFGASGPMHEQIRDAALMYAGVDREAKRGVVARDLDDIAQPWPLSDIQPEVIVCGEVIEHLANPGWFLKRVKEAWPGVPVIITVPNAFSLAAKQHAAKGVENVNPDHVAWYSPKTIRTLLERGGFRLTEFYYYGGTGPSSEGMIVVAE